MPITDKAKRVPGSTYLAENIWKLPVNGRLATRKAQVRDTAAVPILENCVQEGERQVPGGRMALGKTVLATEITAISEFDNEAGHHPAPSVVARSAASQPG
jgi:hypothetical protein